MDRSPKKKKVRTPTKCVVPGCSMRASNGVFHFPKDPARQEIWLNLCGLKEVKKEDRICSSHFKEDDYGFSNVRKTLKPSTVPSQNLPINEQNINLQEQIVLNCQDDGQDQEMIDLSEQPHSK